MKKLILIITLLALVIPSLAQAQANLSQGGTGWSTSTKGDLLVGTSTGLRYSRFPIGSTNRILKASSTSPFGMEWVATSTLGFGAGGSGTVTSVDMTVPTGLSITGNPITTSGTLALTLTSGYNIPLTASTTEWARAYASTTALTPAYIRGLLSGTSPITFNSSTGAIGFDFSTNNTWTGGNTFVNSSSTRHFATTSLAINASTTNQTVSGILYLPALSSGCLELSGGLVTSTGVACGSGGGGITSLNGLTGSSQTFATTSGGTLFTITSSGSTHTFNFPVSPTFSTTTMNALIVDEIFSRTTAGTIFKSANGTQVANFGAANTANALFSGAVNVTTNLTVDTDTLFVDGTNNRVGIGTTTPIYANSVVGTSSLYGNLFINPNLRSPQLNAFGSGLHPIQAAWNTADIVGATLNNMSTAINGGVLINLGNASSTVGGIGLAQRFNANIVFSGPNYNGCALSTCSLRPNSLAMFANDGDFTMAVGTSSPNASLNWQIGSTTFNDWAPDMRMDYLGNLSLGWATTTAPARLAIRGRFSSNDVLFDIASSTATGYATSTATSLFKVLANGRIGIASSSPSHLFTVAGDINLTGALRFNGLPGTSGQILKSTGTSANWVNNTKTLVFTYATTTWSGTTTITLGPAFNAQTFSTAKCFTDTGTLGSNLTDGTNVMNPVAISTTVGAGTTLSTNNTYTAGEKRYINIGSPASSPTVVSCSIEFYE